MSNYCFTLLRLDWFYYLPVYVSSTVSTFIQRERNVAIANTEKFNDKRMKSIGKKGKKNKFHWQLHITCFLSVIDKRRSSRMKVRFACTIDAHWPDSHHIGLSPRGSFNNAFSREPFRRVPLVRTQIIQANSREFPNNRVFDFFFRNNVIAAFQYCALLELNKDLIQLCTTQSRLQRLCNC